MLNQPFSKFIVSSLETGGFCYFLLLIYVCVNYTYVLYMILAKYLYLFFTFFHTSEIESKTSIGKCLTSMVNLSFPISLFFSSCNTLTMTEHNFSHHNFSIFFFVFNSSVICAILTNYLMVLFKN